MSERINCELFKVSNSKRLRVNRGMGVKKVGQQTFLDAQAEPLYFHGQPLPTDRKNLKLATSRSDPPAIENEFHQEPMLKQASLNETILYNLKRADELRRYRLHAPVDRAIGKSALVGVVNYDDPDAIFACQTPFSRYLQMFRSNERSYDSCGIDSYAVVLILLGPGQSFSIQTSDHCGNETNFKLRYDPESEEGLVVYRPDSLPPTPPHQPPFSSGDREPRQPLPSAPPTAVELIEN
ncbi:MAG: hypothetical protein ACREGA_02645 [Candidatus Saccharimonadales bacterium]